MLKHPGVTSAISSMNIRKFAEQNIAALEEPPLSDEFFEHLVRNHRWIRNLYRSKFTADKLVLAHSA